MGVLNRISDNLRDISSFGPSVVLRHLSRFRADRVASVAVRGIGRVFIRTGQSDIAALRQVFAKAEYDISWPEEVAARIAARYAAIIEDGGRPIIVDAGANIGAASLWFNGKYPKAYVAAVEPHPGNAGILRLNIGNRPHCTVMEAAIGSETGFAGLIDEGLGGRFSRHARTKDCRSSRLRMLSLRRVAIRRSSLRSISKVSKAICFPAIWIGLLKHTW